MNKICETCNMATPCECMPTDRKDLIVYRCRICGAYIVESEEEISDELIDAVFNSIEKLNEAR